MTDNFNESVNKNKGKLKNVDINSKNKPAIIIAAQTIAQY